MAEELCERIQRTLEMENSDSIDYEMHDLSKTMSQGMFVFQNFNFAKHCKEMSLGK